MTKKGQQIIYQTHLSNIIHNSYPATVILVVAVIIIVVVVVADTGPAGRKPLGLLLTPWIGLCRIRRLCPL